MQKKQKIIIAGSSALVFGAGVFLWIKTSLGRRIIRIAKGFAGQKEIPPNIGFANPVFESMMRSLGGWWSGAEWCASFARLVWMLALKGRQQTIADKLLSPSTQITFMNFKNDTSGLFSISSKPKPGSIVIWRSRSRPAKGHAGIYIAKIAGKHFFIEGNVKNAVQLMNYTDYRNISKDLYLRGFINW